MIKKSRRMFVLANSAAMMLIGVSLVAHSQFADGAVPNPDASRIFGAGCYTRVSSSSGCKSSWSCSYEGVFTDLNGTQGPLSLTTVPFCGSTTTCGQYTVLGTCSSG